MDRMKIEREEMNLMMEFTDVIQKVGALIKKHDIPDIRVEMDDDFYTMDSEKLQENLNDAKINGNLKTLVTEYIEKMQLLLVKIEEKSKEI